MGKSVEVLEVKEEQSIAVEKKCPLPWWKRIGFLGFMFFFLKGLGWIALAVITYIWGPEALDGVKDFLQISFKLLFLIY